MRRYNPRTAALMSVTAIAVMAVAPTVVTASGASASDRSKQDEQRREQAKKLEEKQREQAKKLEEKQREEAKRKKEVEHDHEGDDDGDDSPIVLTPTTTAPPVTVAPTTAQPTVPTTVAPTTTQAPVTTAPTTVAPPTTKPALTTTTKAPVVTTPTTTVPAPLIRASAAFLAAKIGAPVRMDTTVTNDAATPAAVTVVITMSSTGALPGYLEAKSLTGAWTCSAYAAKPVSPQKYTCTGTLAAKASGAITVSSGSSIVGTPGQTLIAGIVVNPGGIATGATATL